MFCTQCGANIEADPRYCWKCGHVFTPEELEKMKPGSRVQSAAPAPAPKPQPAQGQPAGSTAAQGARQEAQNSIPPRQGSERNAAGSGYQGRAAQAPPVKRPPETQAAGAAGEQPGAGAVKIFAIIMGIVFTVFALMSLGGVFSNLGSIFSAGNFGRAVSRLILFLLALARLICLAAAAGILFYMFASFKNVRARSFYITLVLACAVLLGVDLFRYLVIRMTAGSWHGSSAWLLRDIIALLVAAGGMYIIMSVNKMSVLEGVAGESMGDVVSGALNGFKDDVSASASERSQANAAKAQAAEQRQAQARANAAQRQAAPAYGSVNPEAVNLPPGNGGLGPLKTDRSLLVLIVLNLITCAIYNLYFIHKLAKDVNILCEGDGKETPGLLKYFCFTLITCGFYSYFWWYNLCNRMQENAPRYGLRFSENGTSYLVWTLVGAMSCGVGYFYATYMVIRNMNELCKQYNKN